MSELRNEIEEIINQHDNDCSSFECGLQDATSYPSLEERLEQLFTKKLEEETTKLEKFHNELRQIHVNKAKKESRKIDENILIHLISKEFNCRHHASQKCNCFDKYKRLANNIANGDIHT